MGENCLQFLFVNVFLSVDVSIIANIFNNELSGYIYFITEIFYCCHLLGNKLVFWHINIYKKKKNRFLRNNNHTLK